MPESATRPPRISYLQKVSFWVVFNFPQIFLGKQVYPMGLAPVALHRPKALIEVLWMRQDFLGVDVEEDARRIRVKLIAHAQVSWLPLFVGGFA